MSSAYLGPIRYFTKLMAYPQVTIEKEEHYHKQSYRNRCLIMAANGPLMLSVPVFEGPGAKAPMKELRLSYDHQWQKIHWRSIVSAYNNSPFFEYYSDDLAPFFHEQKWKFLIDYNSRLQDVVLELMGIKVQIDFTQEYVPEEETDESTDDFRYSIHPKPSRNRGDLHFVATPYNQVFQEKFGFMPNLSILDLLCNEGPGSADILKGCIR